MSAMRSDVENKAVSSDDVQDEELVLLYDFVLDRTPSPYLLALAEFQMMCTISSALHRVYNTCVISQSTLVVGWILFGTIVKIVHNSMIVNFGIIVIYCRIIKCLFFSDSISDIKIVSVYLISPS